MHYCGRAGGQVIKLTLVGKHPEVDDVTTLIFEPDQPVSWQAGQFLQYTLPHDSADDRGQQRWFTISSAPYEKTIQITTRFFDKRSSFKHHLHDLAIGDQIDAGQPEGDFLIDDATKSYIFIAGGIGITPFHSILKQAQHDGHQLDVILLYGNRDESSSVFLDEFKTMATDSPKFKLHNILEPQRIDAGTIKSVTDYRDRLIYVSGPEPMVEAFEKILADLGIPEEQQKRDYFPGYEWPPAK